MSLRTKLAAAGGAAVLTVALGVGHAAGAPPETGPDSRVCAIAEAKVTAAAEAVIEAGAPFDEANAAVAAVNAALAHLAGLYHADDPDADTVAEAEAALEDAVAELQDVLGGVDPGAVEALVDARAALDAALDAKIAACGGHDDDEPDDDTTTPDDDRQVSVTPIGGVQTGGGPGD